MRHNSVGTLIAVWQNDLYLTPSGIDMKRLRIEDINFPVKKGFLFT